MTRRACGGAGRGLLLVFLPQGPQGPRSQGLPERAVALRREAALTPGGRPRTLRGASRMSGGEAASLHPVTDQQRSLPNQLATMTNDHLVATTARIRRSPYGLRAPRSY